MKIQLDINDIKSIDISHGTMKELIALQNKISEKINEIDLSANSMHRIYQEYSTSDYNAFLDICIAMSFEWYDEEHWNKIFLLRLKSFILHTQGISIETSELNSSTIDSILRMYGFPYHVIESYINPMINDNNTRTIKYKKLELIKRR